jgi:protein involved in polysaccharide export with SLBB domain
VEPGAYDLSSLSSAINVLVAAGGVTERGSLRTIKHYRGKQLIEVVDAYDLLLRGVGLDQKRFESGDSLLVPPVGAQVRIEGMVRRPAIYELRGGMNLEEALDLAGGILPAAALKHVEVERLVAHESRTMISLNLDENAADKDSHSQLSTFRVQDGDRIHIFPIAPYNDQAIYLQGHVLRPGRYSYKSGMTVTDLITSYTDLLPEPAGNTPKLFGLIRQTTGLPWKVLILRRHSAARQTRRSFSRSTLSAFLADMISNRRRRCGSMVKCGIRGNLPQRDRRMYATRSIWREAYCPARPWTPLKCSAPVKTARRPS